MFHPPEEPAPVQGLIAYSGHDAVISIIRGEMMLRVRHPTDADSHVLQRIDPTWNVVLRHVRPFMQLLREYLDGAEDREE